MSHSHDLLQGELDGELGWAEHRAAMLLVSDENKHIKKGISKKRDLILKANILAPHAPTRPCPHLLW